MLPTKDSLGYLKLMSKGYLSSSECLGWDFLCAIASFSFGLAQCPLLCVTYLPHVEDVVGSA